MKGPTIMTNETVQIPSTVRALSYDDAIRECQARRGHSEISDAAARTVAMSWQSPGSVGHVLASLASGREVTVRDLHTDIHRTWLEATTLDERLGLDMLATWAMNRPTDA